MKKWLVNAQKAQRRPAFSLFSCGQMNKLKWLISKIINTDESHHSTSLKEDQNIKGKNTKPEEIHTHKPQLVVTLGCLGAKRVHAVEKHRLGTGSRGGT